PRRRRLLPVLVLLLLAGAGVAGYLLWFRPKPEPSKPDMEAALAANARGVGHMERFDFKAAANSFEEVVRIAPDWQPGRINLGIALFNQNTPDTITRGKQALNEVLERDADNKHAHYCLGIIASDAGQFPTAYEHFQKVNKLDPEDA